MTTFAPANAGHALLMQAGSVAQLDRATAF